MNIDYALLNELDIVKSAAIDPWNPLAGSIELIEGTKIRLEYNPSVEKIRIMQIEGPLRKLLLCGRCEFEDTYRMGFYLKGLVEAVEKGGGFLLTPTPSEEVNSPAETIIEEALRRGGIRKEELIEMSKPLLTIQEASEKLKLSVGAVKKFANSRLLFYVENEEGEMCLPSWQFQGGKIISGLIDVLQALPDYGWVADLIFFNDKHFRLDGLTPKEALLKGEAEKVKQCAQTQWQQGGS